MVQRLFILLFLIGLAHMGDAQSEAEKEYQAEYNKRIKLSRIGDVYIPKNMEDAFMELKSLSEPAGIEKFISTPEEIVATRLNGGIGRWMLINWGFNDGSRLSHKLKSLGIHHPDDMSLFLLVSFHRHLNNKPLDIETQVALFQANRKAAYEASIERDTIKIQN